MVDRLEDQEPLTLALSRRERGLTEVDGRGTPTCDTESNSSFEKHNDLLPFPTKVKRLTEVHGGDTPT
jgi:hypothetical protein